MISSFRTASPADPSSSFARPDWTSHDSSFSRWNWRLSDSPALTKSTLPTYWSACAQISSYPHGFSTFRGWNAHASRVSRFGESIPSGDSTPSGDRVKLRMRAVVLLSTDEVLGRVDGDPEALVPV